MSSPGNTLTPIEQALPQLLSRVSCVAGVESLPLLKALNRVAAEEIVAPCQVPGEDNSAMDGYALQTSALASGQTRFPVSQRIPAGSVGKTLAQGTVARIFTGAPIPAGANAVVMQENTRLDAGLVEILAPVIAGENIRPAGADVRQGERLVSAGHRLRAPDIGLLAGCGLAEVAVRKPLRIAVLTTGDELVRPGQPLQPGQIYNSNLYTLSTLLQALGHEVIDHGIVADTREATEQALRDAAQGADCLISSGGVSVGEEDHVRHAVERIGELAFWKLAIKPGKPFAFGSVEGKPFFGLPGNPVSSFVNFALVVRPCLDKMGGVTPPADMALDLPAGFSLARTGIRQEYLRVVVQRDAAGQRVLHLTGNQSSGVLSSVSRCDGLAIVPPDTAVAPGDLLRFLPLSAIVAHV